MSNEVLQKYVHKLKQSRNIILHGAPGTGKTYLAKEISAYMVSDGECENYDDLSEEQKQQIGFVQFHPSYDYTDFVEGLRPVTVNNQISFKLEDGIFKKFADNALDNLKNAEKSRPNSELDRSYIELQKMKASGSSHDELMKAASKVVKLFLENTKLYPNGDATNKEANGDVFETNKNQFSIKSYDSSHVTVKVISKKINDIELIRNHLVSLLAADQLFNTREDIGEYLNLKNTQRTSYYLSLYKRIINLHKKKYIFIIDEINRGEISKIFGELFFSIDPGYRGEKGAVLTQYSNLHEDPNEKFYIPENVYIIGTMNDIDRSVESFDFAMRRRFRFIELRADEQEYILDGAFENDKKLEDAAKKCMHALNEKIADTEDLNENYQIGPAYFLKLKDLDSDNNEESDPDTILRDKFDLLWKDYLEPLLSDYVQGMYNEEEKIKAFKEAYDSALNNSLNDGNNQKSSDASESTLDSSDDQKGTVSDTSSNTVNTSDTENDKADQG